MVDIHTVDMDLLRKMCNVFPDGVTGIHIVTSMEVAFGKYVEGGLIPADFTQSQIDEMKPQLACCPACGSQPSTSVMTSVIELVKELEPFKTMGDWNSTKNFDGEEYVTMVRNLVNLPTGPTPGAKKVGYILDIEREYVSRTYPHYYRIDTDPPYVLLGVLRDENGEKLYCRVSPHPDNIAPYPLN